MKSDLWVAKTTKKRLRGRWKEDTHIHLMEDKCLKFQPHFHGIVCMFVLGQEREGGLLMLLKLERVGRDSNSKQISIYNISLFLSLFSVSMSLTIFSFLLALPRSFTLLSSSSLPISSRHVFPAALPQCVSMPPLLSFTSPHLLQCPPLSLLLSPFLSRVLSLVTVPGFAV